MKLAGALPFGLLSATNILFAQNTDSLKTLQLQTIQVKAYFKTEPLVSTTSAVSIIDKAQLELHPDNSLVNVVNSIAGVRMEERSPESYRLSIRGSVLRSPFGIRNIRIYLDEIPITDAGGNTYLNLISPANINHLQIMKGPEGSIYGANTGGVVLIDPYVKSADSLYVRLMGEGGMYGYFNQHFVLQKIGKKYLINVSEAYTRSDGYRQNSASQRWVTQLFQQWHYIPKAHFDALVFFSKLNYQTPGGLTLAQFNADPRAARAPTATLPGAVEQKAGIYNTSIITGLTHEIEIRKNLRHVIAGTFSYTDFKNPFITNYEIRRENNVGLRTYIDWEGNANERVGWNWTTGLELQEIWSVISDYGNNQGTPDTVQTAYNFNAGQYFAFTRFVLKLLKRINIEASVSVNYNNYQYAARMYGQGLQWINFGFPVQVMPRVATSVKIVNGFYWRAAVSRGYSPPTLAEIHPSANIILKNLKPENGWNYETGLRYQESHHYLWLDLAVYYFRLQNAIVARSDSAGNDYFVNAGGTNQFGVEAQVNVWAVRPNSTKAVRELQFNGSYTFNYFRFRNYYQDENNYSGNYLTGVPPHVLVVSALMRFPLGFFVFVEHNYTAHLPLNDANTQWAGYYNLLQFKVGWHYTVKHIPLEIFVGGNNLLNDKYSLGNDLNASGARYYNAAPARNFYAGAAIGFSR